MRTVIEPIAYLAGVLQGDAWLSSRGYLCLRVADQDFAVAFAEAITAGFGVSTIVNIDERDYWLCRKYNGYQRFSCLPAYSPSSDGERAAWLRGLFDSEGNASLWPKPSGSRSFTRRVSFYSTKIGTLNRAAKYLYVLSIESRQPTVMRASAGHLGSKPVFELALKSSCDNYTRFGQLIGSSIDRKRIVLKAIPESYCADMSQVRREMQATGAATKRRRTINIRYPALLDEIAFRLKAGESTTFRAVQHLDGYWAAHKTLGLKHSEIIEEARRCSV
jgi:hypothetical protein